MAHGGDLGEEGDADGGDDFEIAAELFADGGFGLVVWAADSYDDFEFIGERRGGGGDHDVVDDLVDILEGALDSGGIDRCALELHRLILAAEDWADAGCGPAAGAGVTGDEGDVAGGEADEGHGGGADGGRDELTFDAVGNRPAFIVEDFDVKEFGIEMATHSGVAFAHRAGQFGDAVG